LIFVLTQLNTKHRNSEQPNPNSHTPVGRSTTKKEQRSDNNLYQELSFQDNEESEENEIVTGETFGKCYWDYSIAP